MDRNKDETAPRPPDDAQGERVAKVIARAGLGSRREAEEWIAAGRVAVNGETILSPARNVGVRDTITVDGRPLPQRERTRLFLYHKPRGLVTTTADPEGRPTVFQALPRDLPRVVSVGRLDVGSEGLLLLTNDGGLARVLELPETAWERRYRVRAHGAVTQAQLDALRAGVEVDGVRYGPIEATLDRGQGANVWITVALREGKNREVRNVLGHLGLQVNRLIRVAYGPFELGALAEGACEEVRTRDLRERLGREVIERSGADFHAPVVDREEWSVDPKRADPRPRRSETQDKPRRREREPGGREPRPPRRSSPEEMQRRRSEVGERPHRRTERPARGEHGGERADRRPDRFPRRDDRPGRYERRDDPAGRKTRHDERPRREAGAAGGERRYGRDERPLRERPRRDDVPRDRAAREGSARDRPARDHDPRREPRRGTSHVWRERPAPDEAPRGQGRKAREAKARNATAGKAEARKPKAQAEPQPSAEARPTRRGLLTDRKGRRVLVERIGAPPPAKPRGGKGRPPPRKPRGR